MKVNDVPGPEALKVFVDTPEKLGTTVLVNDHNSLTSFHYRVQDTPGESSPVVHPGSLSILPVSLAHAGAEPM